MVKPQAKRRVRRWKRKRIAGYSFETETAQQLNLSIRTLRKWRQLGIGPPWVKVGRQVVYSDESRVTWLKGQEVQPVKAA
jgi:hypothetical protein